MNGTEPDRIIQFFEALFTLRNESPLSIFDEIEMANFVDGAYSDDCIARCRRASCDTKNPSIATIDAVVECVSNPSAQIRLIVAGLANDSLEGRDAGPRLAAWFPANDLPAQDQAIVELAYQVEHDILDGVSSSYDELVASARKLASTYLAQGSIGVAPI